jgi:phage repressor protein C with HTH and peptisase S24 domain
VKKEVIPTNELMELVIDSIKNNQRTTIKVTGSSMTPFFTDGKTSVTVKHIEKELQKYDVILFKYQESYKLHRIIQMKDNRIVVSGDNLLSKEIVTFNDIIGVVESFETDGVVTLSSDKDYLKRVKRNLFFKPISIRLRRFK